MSATDPKTEVWRIAAGRRAALWADLMDVCHEFLLAGLRRRIGPDGDLAAAYREWYGRQRRAHDEVRLKVLRRIREAEAQRGQ